MQDNLYFELRYFIQKSYILSFYLFMQKLILIKIKCKIFF